jgi:hypothetical protein
VSINQPDMKNYIIPALFSIIVFIGACSRKDDNSTNVVTKRIQYDVSIKTPDPEFDWWVQNIEGEKRETLIQHIMTAVSEGRVKAYDFMSNQQLSGSDISLMLHRVDSISLERADPPHELYDTVITKDLKLADITRLRFLEEWRMDEKTLSFSKKVTGICPLLEVYAADGELRGYKPLFWVFFDDQYPEKFKAK